MSERTNMLEAEQIDAIEGRLAGTLRRVRPPEDFVTRLRGNIHIPERSQLVFHVYDWERLLVVLSGVISGSVAILVVARAMYYLFGRRHG